MTTDRVRTATTADRDAIRALHLAAFPPEERELVARLAVDLLGERTDPPTFALVAEADGVLVGHVAFSPLAVVDATDHDAPETAFILAPLAVAPAHHGRGVGSRLVRLGVDRLRAASVDLLFVYGDPAYYGRFGFDAATAAPFAPPVALEHPFGWLATMLRDARASSSSRPVASVRLDCVASLRDPALW